MADDLAETSWGVIVDPEYGYRRLDPLPDQARLELFYERHYRDFMVERGHAPDLTRLLSGGEDAEAEREWLAAVLHADVIDALARHVPASSGRRVLDVGAGTGDLVAALADAGWDAEGVEPAIKIAAAGRERGLRIAGTSAETYLAARAQAVSPPFAAVTLMNVLEHALDPAGLLRGIRAVLDPGGVVLVRVPNDFSPLQLAAVRALGVAPWWISSPDHVNYFDHASIARLVAGRGYAVLEQTADYPMELFLLQGEDYTTDPEVGRACHARRRRMDLGLPAEVRRSMGRAWAAAGVGRNVLLVARATA